MSEARHVTYLVVGAGPGGLQLGHLLGRAGLSYLVVERAPSAGAFFERFPRHRKLISINKVHTGCADPETNLRWDWNSLLHSSGPLFGEVTQRYFPAADDMVRYLDDFARRNAIEVDYDTEVATIARAGGVFDVETSGGRFTADRVIVATGMAADHVPPIPGIELAESYGTMPVDPAAFRGQRVLILGKGNSAFETADNLVEDAATIHLVSRTPVRLAWRTHFVGHLRAVNNNVLDTYRLKSQNTVIDADVERIRRDGEKLRVSLRYRHAQGERAELTVDRVLRCTGFRMDTTIFAATAKPATVRDGRFPELTSAWESANVEGLYFAGTLMQSRDYQRHFSAFIHGFRYNVEALVHLLLERYHGVPWPTRALAGPIELGDWMVRRMNASSVLFQQPGFIADVARVNGDGVTTREAVPVDRFLEDDPGGHGHGLELVLTLEYGEHDHPDPFDIERFPEDPATSSYLHPVVRAYRDGERTAELHVPEDLENDWSTERCQQPLRAFLHEQCAEARVAAG